MNTTINNHYNQSNSRIEQVSLKKDLQQAKNVINAEYQQLDAEDRVFLTQVINKAIENLTSKGGSYVGN